MRFLLDESLPPQFVKALQRAGFEVLKVRQLGLGGADDMVVYATAQALGAVLVTADKGFGDIRHFPLGTHHGIVVLRVIGKPERQWKALERALCQDLKGQNLTGALVIVTERKTRVRRLQSG